MSLIGIDVGSSAVKVAAYCDRGVLLGVVSHSVQGEHPEAGRWEQDPEQIWQATSAGMRQLAADEALRNDPPRAIAVSASGRENFLADADGLPLTPCVMGADTRGAELESPPEGAALPEPWSLSCGHLRERMDPVFRLQWWRQHHPDIVEQAAHFLGWHDFLGLRMSGRIATDRCTASRYAAYDLESNDWDPGRATLHGLEAGFLPDVLPWPSVVDELDSRVAEDWGLPTGVRLCLGGLDVNCAAIGAGVVDVGSVCLVSGSYENLLAVSRDLPTSGMLLRGLSVMPHPGRAGRSVLAVHPTGNAVMDWARDLVGAEIETLEADLNDRMAPSPLQAVPYLSGSMVYWEEGRKATGALVGLTLATTPTDVVQAFMEGIAYDHVNTLSLMRQEGVPVSRLRATGGGTRSAWWTQLKADLTDLPIEVVDQPEPGTLGAAILAGLAIGVFDDLEETCATLSRTRRVHEPDPRRSEGHGDRFERYRKTVTALLREVY